MNVIYSLFSKARANRFARSQKSLGVIPEPSHGNSGAMPLPFAPATTSPTKHRSARTNGTAGRGAIAALKMISSAAMRKTTSEEVGHPSLSPEGLRSGILVIPLAMRRSTNGFIRKRGISFRSWYVRTEDAKTEVTRAGTKKVIFPIEFPSEGALNTFLNASRPSGSVPLRSAVYSLSYP